VGVAAGGLAIHLADPVTYHRLLLAVALTCLLLGLSYGLLPGAPHAPALATEPRYRDALGDSKLARYLGFIFLVTFVSYGSLFTGLGALVAIDLRQSTRIVALGLVATSVAVVALQRPVYALVTRLGTRRAILLAVSCLAAAWLVLLASLAGRPAVIPAVVGFALLLAVGDAALAPIRTPLLLAIAPARLRGRYSGLTKLAHSAANIAGPIAATEAIGHRLAGLWLPVLATLAAGAGLVGASLTRHVAIPDQGET
jgi:MFS family permease